MKLSNFFLDRSKREIKHLRLENFELLAFVSEDVGRLASLFGVFEPDETLFFNASIRPDDVCIDVGGNIGYFSMLMAKCASQGRVHVFEPIPLNAAMIVTNAELNEFPNVIVTNAALGLENGNAQFSISSDSAYSSMRATGTFSEARSINVPLMMLDSYVEKQGLTKVDVMKVDVEGAEEMVLVGGEKLLSDPARQPRLIMLELYDANLAPYGSSVAAIVERMVRYGYAAFVLIEGGKTLKPYTPEFANVHYNIFFQPR